MLLRRADDDSLPKIAIPSMYSEHLSLALIIVSMSCQALAFHNQATTFRQEEWRKATGVTRRTVLSAKGFGVGPPSSRSTTNKNVKESIERNMIQKRKQMEKKIKNKYGGTTPEAIAKGTQASMEAALQTLPHHVQRAAHLYQIIRKWNVYYNRLSILDQSSDRIMNSDQWINVQHAQDEYHRLCSSHPQDVSDFHMHQLLQRLTWDASADAKAARVVLSGGTMKADVQQRIQTACKWAKESMGDDPSTICLDVGCGYGAIVPDLLHAGIRADQIHGIDISTEMIRNAKAMYGECQFHVTSFYDVSLPKVGTVMFCSSLHDMPDIPRAIRHAAVLLQSVPSSRLVVVHALGAHHVISQMHTNPILVPRALPDEQEWHDLAKQCGMRVLVTPAAPSTPRDGKEGYLAVLETIPQPLPSSS